MSISEHCPGKLDVLDIYVVLTLGRPKIDLAKANAKLISRALLRRAGEMFCGSWILDYLAYISNSRSKKAKIRVSKRPVVNFCTRLSNRNRSLFEIARSAR